ncbi:VOC family protein, partial [Pseudomonas aeruginosa]
YRDAPAAIDWLCRTFGFQRKLVVPGEDGQVLHAELTYASPNGANGMLMLGSSVRDNAYGRLMRHVDEAGGLGAAEQGVGIGDHQVEALGIAAG